MAGMWSGSPGLGGEYWPVGNNWAIRPIIQIMLSSRQLERTRVKTHSNLRDISALIVTMWLRWLRGHSVHYPANGAPAPLSPLRCSPFARCLRLIVHTLWPSPTSPTRSVFFLLCVWIIREPRHICCPPLWPLMDIGMCLIGSQHNIFC